MADKDSVFLDKRMSLPKWLQWEGFSRMWGKFPLETQARGCPVMSLSLRGRASQPCTALKMPADLQLHLLLLHLLELGAN